MLQKIANTMNNNTGHRRAHNVKERKRPNFFESINRPWCKGQKDI